MSTEEKVLIFIGLIAVGWLIAEIVKRVRAERANNRSADEPDIHDRYGEMDRDDEQYDAILERGWKRTEGYKPGEIVTITQSKNPDSILRSMEEEDEDEKDNEEQWYEDEERRQQNMREELRTALQAKLVLTINNPAMVPEFMKALDEYLTYRENPDLYFISRDEDGDEGKDD